MRVRVWMLVSAMWFASAAAHAMPFDTASQTANEPASDAVPATDPVTASWGEGVPAPAPDEAAAADVLSGLPNARSGIEAMPPLDRALALLPRPTPFRAFVQCLRGVALVDAKQTGAAQPALGECDRTLPENPTAQMMIGEAALHLGETRRAASRIAFALARRPELFGMLGNDAADTLILNLGYISDAPELPRLLAALRGTSYVLERPERLESATTEAIASDVRAGRKAQAIALLGGVVTPGGALELLVDRQYTPIWPEIEAWAGDLTGLRDARVAAVRAAFARDGSLENRGRLARVLSGSGHRDEAIALLRAGVADRAGWDAGGYDIGALASQLATLLNADGRGAEGVAVLDTIDRAMAGKAFDGRVNLLTNRASLKIWNGRPADGLTDIEAAAHLARAKTSDAPEPGALFWYDALRACAYHKLGRETEARALMATLAPTMLANRGAFRTAAACLGDRPSYRALVLADLGKRDRRGGVLIDFQRPVRGPGRDEPLVLAERAMVTSLRGDAAIAAALREEGRTLPPVYADALREWRD